MITFPSTASIAKIYDRIGPWQDTQAFYEDQALTVLLEHGKFDFAKNVYEAGCGTGRIAQRLLRNTLSPECRYVGADISARMVELARARTAACENALIIRADVTSHSPGTGFDRVLSLFVIDLMDDAAIAAFLQRAYEALDESGLLCIAGLAEGSDSIARVISELWKRVHDVVPALVGGCRPGSVAHHLDPARWRIQHVERNCRYGISSEAVIASKVR